MRTNVNSSLAGIEYHGVDGVSAPCKDAIKRLIQYGDRITSAKILSNKKYHCFLLTVNDEDPVVIKCGFSSGYGGEGPSALSYVLQLLYAHGAEIKEYEVDQEVIDRLNMSALTKKDIKNIEEARPIQPSRWPDYILDKPWGHEDIWRLWWEFPPIIPYAIIDNRIIDLAMDFLEQPDASLLTGYRRLEDIVRKRTKIDEHGANLFSKAFLVKTAKLGWKGLDVSEQTGRANLFVAVYMAYRNRRAHRELESRASSQLAEFMLLNHLYLLESESCELDDNGYPINS